MMGNDSIDLSLKNIWQSWFNFKKGKWMTHELHTFQFYLEKNLSELQQDLKKGSYRQGNYRKFVVHDNKRREISCAPIRDRIVHRLLYDYLVPIFDKTFIYDAWSCRKGKGLVGAIERAQNFLKKNPRAYVWRADIQKFFDSVDPTILFKLIKRRIQDPKALQILHEIIFGRERERVHIKDKHGIPIGNLTSQIFANIYLNELDRFIKHDLKVKYYLRYGDDFILIHPDLETLKQFRFSVCQFLKQKLQLSMNPRNDKILKTRHGLKFLGVVIHPDGRALNKRNKKRIKSRLNRKNASSYYGLIKKHEGCEYCREFGWWIYELLEDQLALDQKLEHKKR